MAHTVSQERWSSWRGFLLSAIGFSVGLGNIWRFPYVAGEYGGSAFIIIYLVCAFAIGWPLLVSELAIGRTGRSDPPGSYRATIAVSCENGRRHSRRFLIQSPDNWDGLSLAEE